MATLASLRILLGLDSGDVSKGAGRVRGELKGVQAEANKTRDAFTGIKQGIAAGFGLGAGIGAFNLASQATREFTEFIGDSITKASALNETLSKSAVIFGQDAAAVEAWGRTAATAFGQSTGQAIEARATLGNLFKTMGLGQADVLGMSQNVVELASDLASFNNIGVDEALEKLRSGLVGQAEPLRTLGVQLTEANVKAKAMALGLVAANGALSESAKVQARYALILEQTGTAQGDFGRTSEGLANQQKELDANIANLSTEFGALVVGPMTSLVSILNDDVIPALRTTGELIGEAGKAAADAAGPVADFIDSLTPDDPGFNWQDLLAPENRPKGIPELALEFAELAGLIKDTGLAAQDFASTQGPVAGALSNTAGATGTAGTALAALTGGTVALTAATQAGSAALLTEREATLAAAAAAAELKKFTDAMGDSAAEANNDLLTLASGFGQTGDAALISAGKIDTWADAMQRAWAAGTLDMSSAQDAFEQFGPAAPLTGDNGGMSSGDFYIFQLQEAERLRIEAAKAAADAAREAAAEAKRRAAEAKRLADEAARDAEKAAKEAQRAQEEMWRAAQEAADQYFDRVHQQNRDAIDDIRDRRNAELDAANAAIQAPVDAERQRLEAIRDAEREQGLRSAVATAETPADLLQAQQDLQRFLQDERVEFMQGQADANIALNEAARENANAAADMAIAAEALRDIAARERFDPRVRTNADGTVASVTTGDFISDAPLVINLYIDGQQITEVVDRRQYGRARSTASTGVSTGSTR